MRGKHFATADGSESKRITPAHAGKTRDYGAKETAAADHPRACGENSPACSRACFSFGSPPRMRGKPPLKRLADSTERITPAHAGKTKPMKKLV